MSLPVRLSVGLCHSLLLSPPLSLCHTLPLSLCLSAFLVSPLSVCACVYVRECVCPKHALSHGHIRAVSIWSNGPTAQTCTAAGSDTMRSGYLSIYQSIYLFFLSIDHSLSLYLLLVLKRISSPGVREKERENGQIDR